MTHDEIEIAIKGLQAELKDLRRDAIEPQEQVNRELTDLQHKYHGLRFSKDTPTAYERRLLGTLAKYVRELTGKYDELKKEIKQMALDLSKLNDAATALGTAATDLTTLASQLPGILANASAADQAQLDPVIAAIQTGAASVASGVAAIKAALPAPPPTPA